MRRNRKPKRRGAVLPLVALLMVPLLAMVAFAVDYGYLLKVRTDLQRAADAAALAALQDLVPAADGTQDLAAARNRVREYATRNMDASFQVLDADVSFGRYDPSVIYSHVSLLSSGIYDTVRVTVRRDAQANSPVSLFFARVLGIGDANVAATATAVLQKATILRAGADVLPFSIPLDVWNSRNPGDTWSVYGDGKLTDASGATIPGNWGTVDIGPANNSTADLREQILNGLRQSDLDALFADGRIPTNTHIDGTLAMWLNADPGLSSGMKSAVQAIHGQTRMIPIYDTLGGQPQGNNLEYRVVCWGVVTVVDSQWNGANNTFVLVQKSYTYDGELPSQVGLSNTSGVIDGAFTSPVLVE